ncbi:hypothetical protein ACNF42_02455 [Cuniculiplasma sp. SKW3]|uniref:hypothetical protein n=1 Tax=Cuniculiplasma sp. SKW3 TaxID=3400170 RepID=UPI003FD49BB5
MVSRDDNVDGKIIKYLNWSGREIAERPTYWQISKEIGVNPKIISNRIQKMMNDGFIRNIGIMPKVSFLNLAKVGVFCEIKKGITPEEEENLGKLDFIFGVHTFNIEMNKIFIEIIYENGTSYEGYLNEIGEILTDVKFLERFPCKMREINLDRKSASLIQILSEDALLPLNEIGKIMKITSGKVKKIMKKILAQGGFRFITSVSGYRNFFMNISEVFIKVEERRKNDVMTEIFRKVGNMILYDITEFEGLIILCLNIENLSLSRDIFENLSKIGNVEKMECFFPYKVQYYQPEIMRKKISEITGEQYGKIERPALMNIEEESYQPD